MIKDKKIKNIIIQAGGRGLRLGIHTNNKPKALVSVNGDPIIINQMNIDPSANYFIIVDYKKEVLERYLKIYFPAKYTLVKPVGKQTSSGIKECLKLMPEKTPFLILWCDLYFERNIYPNTLRVDKNNYIGLSGSFVCRWKFEKGKLIESQSVDKGVGGVFIFKDKNELRDIPDDGEFCEYLRSSQIKFKDYKLKYAREIGTIDAYADVIKSFYNTRPFNSLTIRDGKVIKHPKNKKGEELGQKERNWYKVLKKNHLDFIPEIYKYNPLVMQQIKGNSLFQKNLLQSEKKKILKQIITNLNVLHSLSKPIKNKKENDFLAILTKTKERLDLIAPLIPSVDSEYITINNKKCINFYKNWDIVEKILVKYFPNQYVYIHGDLTFSNILYENKTKKIYFLDPRGYYGKYEMYGDADYDWAKVYYSLVGNYDQFNRQKFNLELDEKNYRISIQSNGWEFLENDFFILTGCDSKKIKAYNAIMWLSLTSYVSDNYDSICGAFYEGIYLMQDIYEETYR